MDRLIIENFGPIHRADITFGDLTVFVGPQATGKSIALQILRLLIDNRYIVGEFKRYGLLWSNKVPDFLDAYLGEGMRGLWTSQASKLTRDGEVISLSQLLKKSLLPAEGEGPEQPRLFYIPAQRVLTLRNGWPRPFTDYSPGDPFAVREFSERLRILMELEFSDSTFLFPGRLHLNWVTKDLVRRVFFPGFYLRIDKYFAQKRLILKSTRSGQKLPFMVWSTGQREFVPLLLGLYWLMPVERNSRRGQIGWVMIEELEMGLHPQAISVLLFLVLQLLDRGYRVCLSTHSQHVLDLVWALGLLREHGAKAKQVLDLFDSRASTRPLRPVGSLRAVANGALEKSAKVYYFAPDGYTHDITKLDPGSDNPLEASWGGLGEFSGRVADVVAEVVAASERRAPE
jgi:AAA domain, putative AbiEii toxin, Type IV TA system/AAA ATPase domain